MDDDRSAARHDLIHLRAAGTSLLLDVRGAGMPVVLHWGADLGAGAGDQPAGAWDPPVANSAFDAPVVLSLLPAAADGYLGRPGMSGHRDRTAWSVSLRRTAVERIGAGAGTDDPDGAATDAIDISAVDHTAGLALRTELRLHPSGVLRVRHVLRNDADAPYHLAGLMTTLPLPGDAQEVLDLTGRWCRERHPQRRALGQGAWVRESRHGRTGHDSPLVFAAGTAGFSFRSGEVWAAHLGWSGNQTSWAERRPDGHGVLGAGELLEPGEVVLDRDQEYATPWWYAVHSTRGLDGVSAAYHAFIRARPVHPTRPRPVVLNTWEAVYFRQDLAELKDLADTAADLGVERFVLDDGWFRHRRDDSAGLGDWWVDEGVWPDGLGPLIDHVRSLGMEFGLWVEPEMVNPDSDLYRAHPEWVLRPGGDRLPIPWRNQQVLDLTRPDAYEHILGRLRALLSAHDIAYLKWDHNRDVSEAGDQHGRPAVAGQTRATYRLLDRLRADFPGVEIESCSSGGGRVDLGILQRTDRVWASDTNDALDRQMIQRWTGLLLPPELVGAHVGPPTAHTTGRTHGLGFRVATALFGHFGLEWDVRRATPGERQALAAAIAWYKRFRWLLHGGEVVRGDHHDPALAVHGVVAQDGSEALYCVAALTTSTLEMPGRVRLPGLAAATSYAVQAVHPADPPAVLSPRSPGWMALDGCTMGGATLARAGLEMPVLRPEQALLVHCRTAQGDVP